MDTQEREGKICKVKLGFDKITLNSQTLRQKQGKVCSPEFMLSSRM